MPVSVVCDTASVVNAALRDSIATSSGSSSMLMNIGGGASHGLSGCSASTSSHHSIDDQQNSLQSKLVASAKRVLLTKIEYEEVNNYNQSVLDTLKSKYICLRPSPNSLKSNNHHHQHYNHHNNHSTGSPTVISDKDPNQIVSNSLSGHLSQKDGNQLPQAKRILFPRENVQIGWKSSGRKWQVGTGMLNVGNTCYLNSTLQAIFHVPAMANWLMSDATHREKCEDENGSQGGCIICAMSKTLISSQTNPSPIRPYLVYTKLRLVCKHLIMGRQEDAHEFLRYLVEAMEKSYLTRFRNSKELDQYSKETTPLNQILGGYLKSAVRCLTCGHISTTYQHFQDLLLDIRKANTIEEALDGYFARERLEDMGYKCEACKKKVSATKQFSLERAPISLCIQLKRFSMMGTKLNKHVAIRPRLDLTPYTLKKNTEQLTYKLVAMVTHLGASQHCGHYTAIGLTDAGGYYQFDDSCVRPISIQNVLNTNAYIIFYELEDPLQHSRQTSTQISSEHNECRNSTSNRMNGQISHNDIGQHQQRQISNNSSTNNSNLNSKMISKLDLMIGPQLPPKSMLNKNDRNPEDLNGSGCDTVLKTNGNNNNHGNGLHTNSNSSNKLVSSPNNKSIKQNFGVNNSNGNTFQTPNQKLNQTVGSKLVIHFNNNNKGNHEGNNSSVINSNNNNKEQQTTNGSKFHLNSIPFVSNKNHANKNDEELLENLNNSAKSTLPSMPKLELNANQKEKSHCILNGQSTTSKTSNNNNSSETNHKKSLTNGFVKTPKQVNERIHPVKSLVPYESDDESNDSVVDSKGIGDSIENGKESVLSKNNRTYESEDENASSTSTDSSPVQNSKNKSNPPSPPVIKTKAGLWQVTNADATQTSASTTSERKNPFSTGSTTTSVSDRNGKDKKLNGCKNEITNGTVQQLLKLSHRGYGAPVLSWNGQKSNLEKEITEEQRLDRKRELQNSDDEEMDRGRQKKVKIHGPTGRDNPNYNPFQEYQNHQQNQNRRWNSNTHSSNNSRYNGFIYRQNSHHRNHNNFRRHRFHQRSHHQRSGDTGFHNRRNS